MSNIEQSGLYFKDYTSFHISGFLGI